jgi:flagellum-specific ATP synthase
MPLPERNILGQVAATVEARIRGAELVAPIRRYGRIFKTAGEILCASGIRAPIGARCLIETEHNGDLPAEVVGFEDDALLLMAERGVKGVMQGTRVMVQPGSIAADVGPPLLGRIIDAYGEPLDKKPPIEGTSRWPLSGKSVNPMERERITAPFDVGVRAINALTTIGRGMRIGLFAGSGVGKSTLLGMIARHATADVVVVGMIGERGREVRDFVEDHLGDALPRCVVVASPADATALARLHGAWRAAAVAEYFRAEGRHVLLLVDSLTRLAMAGREIGLALGEPAATKGYPPSVFGALAAYVERAGNGKKSEGSITAIYTVLVEGDDHVGDPVADTARAVLDGHVVLNRRLTEAGIYPPIDVSASLSRTMSSLVDADHLHAANRFRALWTRLNESRDLIDIGAYAAGRDPLLDEAIGRAARMESLVRQNSSRPVSIADSVAMLRQCVEQPLS